MVRSFGEEILFKVLEESPCTCRATPGSPSTRSAWPTYWVDAALGTLNWALLPEGAYTGARLAAWISSNFATATYSETTNSLSVAYDGNRLILNDLELRQQFPDAADYPAAPPASPTKPFSVDHMLGPSFVSGGQQVFEFVRMRSTCAAPSWPTPAECWATWATTFCPRSR